MTKAQLKAKITSLRADIKLTKKKIAGAVPRTKELLRKYSLDSKTDALADQLEAISELLYALSSPVPDDFLQAMSKCETHNMLFNSAMKNMNFGCSRNI